MPAPEALSREKHTAILDGAGRVFARRGYEGASMAEITKEAGVSKGTIYHHFDGKAALFGAFVERECERSVIPIFAGLHCDSDVAGTLRQIGTKMLALLISPAGLTIDRVVVSEAARFPELARAFYEAGPARAIAGLSDWLRTQAAAGCLAIDDPVFAAEHFFSLCQHPQVMRRKLGLIDTLTQADINRIVDASVHIFLKAYDRASAPRAHGPVHLAQVSP